MKKMIRTVIKWAPVIYPIVKKMMDKKKQSKGSTRSRSRMPN
ncbi:MULTISPECIES: hypothetical protein [Bacillaceae]|nr:MULTISPECIES: hypothetical protein [Bacillaceae]MCE4050640.1 hypothetical protein [Bacillus sp. Au-Bac7]MCM3031960.1 hypothetical protein [Niallia sp. MER 6]MDL0436035.1 hypothetical protein [Niallia sp. SS-2023]UPO87899.1 hypothetical protein L8T27_001375 [Niallia sp. Man26]